MNNTHTSGLLTETRKIMGMGNYRSGVSTPTGNAANILERSLKVNPAEDSKLSHYSDHNYNP